MQSTAAARWRGQSYTVHLAPQRFGQDFLKPRCSGDFNNPDKASAGIPSQASVQGILRNHTPRLGERSRSMAARLAIDPLT